MPEYKKKPNTEKELLNILTPTVKKWFFSKFKSFSVPQLFGVMEIHSRQNVLISAPTGATKTLTAFLSILNEIVDSAEKGILEDKVYCVYVSPLKALNNDIQHNLLEPLKEMETMVGKELGIRVAVRTGDTTANEKQKMLRKPPHILITTPESLAIMLTSLKFRDHLKSVDWSIIDEIHALADNKRGVHLSLSMERLDHLSPHMTRVGLSATIAPLEEIALYLAGQENNEPRPCKIIDVQFLKDMDLKVLSPVDDLVSVPHGLLHHKMYELIDSLIQEHKSTLIFTNTRAATERVINHLKDKWPGKYTDNIGAHHGSLSKDIRYNIEQRLREGKLKAIVSSTSLELGIDIGYIDLVICLGSPKSVARFLQRAGRSGHKLHETVKARIIVLDRDDLVECSVLLKCAIEKKIDRIDIPSNCLDVLAQQLYGFAIEQKWNIDDLFKVIKQSYIYRNLKFEHFMSIIDYLSGKHVSLEDRHVYAKIWYDPETRMLGKRGRLSRVLYMTNVGTIPDETFVTVKVGDQVIGRIDEGFLERLRKGDVFVLGGEKYEFNYSRGMTATVKSSVFRPPTIPSWSSEMLPLSFDLAMEINKFRRLVKDKMVAGKSKKEILGFVKDYLYVEGNAAQALYSYFREQHDYLEIPSDRTIILEIYNDETRNYYLFHSLFGRRVNDCLARAIAFAVSRISHKDVQLGINDNGFYITSEHKINVLRAVELLRSDKFELLVKAAIDKTEILRRRFRHCAARALMILRNYKGRTKRVGRQQVSSTILLNSVKRISNEFSILEEARREVLEDLMDINNARHLLEGIEAGKVKINQYATTVPSPFAFNLIAQGYTDLLKIEDKVEFLRKMHEMVLAKISLKKGKEKLKKGKAGIIKEEIEKEEEPKFDEQEAENLYIELWNKEEEMKKAENLDKKENLIMMAWQLDYLPLYVKEEIVEFIDEGKEISEDIWLYLNKDKENIDKKWPKELKEFIFSSNKAKKPKHF